MHINKKSKGNSVQRCSIDGTEYGLLLCTGPYDAGTRRANRSKQYAPNGDRERARRVRNLTRRTSNG
jgi:hypothetical protein